MGDPDPDREMFHMSESATEATVEQGEQTTEATETSQTETSATETATEKDWEAEATKWKAFARKHEDAAKANAEKAKRLDEFEESQKTELQKAADRAAAAEAKATELELRAMRAEVSASKGVPVGLLSGTTEEELIASADALIAFRGEQQATETQATDFGAGGRGSDVGTEKVRQLSKEEVEQLYRDKKYDEIEKARESGQLSNLLGA